MPDTRRKPGLGIDRHEAIGLELARIRDRLTTLAAEIENAYPKASKTARLAAGMTGPIDRLRSELEERMFAEHRGDDRATTFVYWPARETRKSPAGTSDHRPHVVAHMPFHDDDLWCCSAHAEEAGAR